MKKTIVTSQLFISLLALSIFMLQSCSSVVQTEFKKGSLIEERPTGKLVELKSAAHLEVTSPLSVKVYEIVQVADEISQTYEKIKLEVLKKRSTKYGSDHHDPWYNHLCGGNFTCKSTIVKDEYLKDSRYENINNKKRAVTSGTVRAMINGSYAQELPIGLDGTASVSIEKYFDVLPEDQDVDVVYSYKFKSVQSVVEWPEVEKTARALLPEYRKRGAANKSAADYITAFRISDDPSDLNNAYNYAASESVKAEIKKLEGIHDRTRFEQAKNNNELGSFIKKYPDSSYIAQAEYLFHLDKDCNGSVIKLSKFNIRRDKGKCVTIVATKFQTTSGNSALFKTYFTWKGDERDLFYIEFPSDYVDDQVQALAKIKGVYTYTKMSGAHVSVPHLRFLAEIPED
jgi:outer membrane protein assembly factor BamD (BamD/ComL family)